MNSSCEIIPGVIGSSSLTYWPLLLSHECLLLLQHRIHPTFGEHVMGL